MSCPQVQLGERGEDEEVHADWDAIAGAVGTRSPTQCRQQWRTQLAPSMVELGEHASLCRLAMHRLRLAPSCFMSHLAPLRLST